MSTSRLDFLENEVELISLKIMDLQAGIVASGHDINAVLNMIRLSLVMAKKAKDIAEREFYETQAQLQVEYMTSIMKYFMALASDVRLEESLNFETIDIKDFIESLVEKFLSYAAYMGIEIISVVPEKIYLNMDASLFKRAISNLIHNALQYSDRGGKIHLSCFQEDKNVIFVVEDEGYGVAKDKLELIWKAFYRVSDERINVANTIEHMGIGLTIVQNIVHMHKGNVYIESAPQQGSVFTIIIPK